MSFTCKGMTFLAFYFNFVIELSTFLFVVTCTSNFANTNTTSTNRFIYISDRTKDIWDTKHDFLTVKLWIPLLFSKRCYMAGRTSCFPRRKVNRNFDITSGFEDLAGRSFEFVWMVPSKNARAFTDNWGDLKPVDWWEDIRSTLTKPSFMWS